MRTTLSKLMALLLVSNLAYAADPTFDCRMGDTLKDGQIVNEKTTFNKDTPKIYLVCESEDVVKGQAIKSEWIADDTNNVAPAGYKIDESTIDANQDLKPDEVWTFTFSLSKPTKGWPLGKYHVALSIEGKELKALKFDIA